MEKELFLGEILSRGDEAYFLREAHPLVEGQERRGILPYQSCLPKDEFVKGQLVYALTINPSYAEELMLTRVDPSLAYHILTREIPGIQQGRVKIVEYACVPGEEATLVIAPAKPHVNVMGIIIGRRGETIARIRELSGGVRFNLIEYVNDRDLLLRLFIPGFKKTGGKLVVDQQLKAAIAIMERESLKSFLKKQKHTHLESLYQQLTGLSLYFTTPENYTSKVAELKLKGETGLS